MDNSHPPERFKLSPGTAVWIIEKENYGTNKYKQGIVRDILTSKPKRGPFLMADNRL